MTDITDSIIHDEGDFLLIDKPFDWTSFDVVAKIRNTFKGVGLKRKVGHSGTLDPKATGLLILATGRKTKEISSLEVLDKVYDGAIKLGVMTESHDVETSEYGHCGVEHLTEMQIRSLASEFEGKHQQQPPMHSAAWHNGKRLMLLPERERLSRNVKQKRLLSTALRLPASSSLWSILFFTFQRVPISGLSPMSSVLLLG